MYRKIWVDVFIKTLQRPLAKSTAVERLFSINAAILTAKPAIAYRQETSHGLFF